MAPGQRVSVQVNDDPCVECTLRRTLPKATRLEFERHFEAGPSTIVIDAVPPVSSAPGESLGVALLGVGFWKGGSQLSWFKRLVPKPLRAYV
jgi:hypothetical protein